MDRSWISNSKPGDSQYEAGMRDFVNFAVKNAGDRSRLPCPCFKCHNFLYRRIDEILGHLSKNSVDRTYTRWIWHGENYEGTRTSDSGNNVNDVHEGPDFNDIPNANEGDRLGDMIRAAQDKFAENPATFEGVLKDSETPLYPGCSKYTRLSSTLRLYNVKAGHGLTDQCFNEVLEVFKDMLPDDNVLASGAYEAKKILIPMGLPYEKIHACPIDCILYRNERESLKNCPVCNASRYKEKEGVSAGFVPGNDIDVYLVPLIDDLKILWGKGVKVFDAHQNENFNLSAILFCTIQDFPAYGNLSGPVVIHTASKKRAFNGKQEFRKRPRDFSGEEVFQKVKDIQITFGKKSRAGISKQGIWGLEVNSTLLRENPRYLPPAAYTLSRKEKKVLCESLAGVKVPEGFSSNFRNLISMENLKLGGLKSHDWHILMQYLLPVAIRSILPKNVRYAIIRLCLFFNAMYAKVINPKDLDNWETEIAIIIFQL
ncbi:uncharacterized protein [Spinacia oleracea]|uniref:Transposase-associated domain-containing protein n=1 Tax=Spinacia oleracea TaxID=3562 RepID=A0ABM3QYZ0_SPIOL|nr:uncharacterized protein LOC110778380 [Spinacia oleracea]